MDCLGCRIANKIVDVNVVYEDELIICILDIEPFNEGHLLILPKNHFHDVDEITPETLSAIMNASVKMTQVLKKVFNPDGITICQNGGIYNDLTHYHMHVIPRYANDGFTWSESINNHGAAAKLNETKQRMVIEGGLH
jgi:diadenosine tetraphosphate (Ap4A) HIT family hydrolase